MEEICKRLPWCGNRGQSSYACANVRPVRRVKSMTESTAMPDLAPAASQIRTLLADVSDDQFPLRTPCDPWTVGDLLDHLMGLTVAFHRGATKAPGNTAGPGDVSVANLDPDWRRELPARLDALVAAWHDPAAWEGMTQVGGVTMPADVMGVVGLNELVMHGWDLARATGQPYGCDAATATAVHTLLSGMTGAGAADGIFGPPVAVAPDAAVFDRAVGLAGRDPLWKP